MAKITRYDGNLEAFASAATGTERTVFGEVTQSDALTDQVTVDFLRGWGIIGPNDFPTKQDFNALGYTVTQLLSYLHQVGVAEWNDEQEYHNVSMVTTSTGLYKSVVNDNIGNDPDTDDGSNWTLIAADADVQALLNTQVTDVYFSPSLSEFVASEPPASADYVEITSYYSGWAATVAGPLGGHRRHRTGASAGSPTVGSPVSPSTIGTGAQAGYVWDANGEEWFISENPIDGSYNILCFGAIGNNSTDNSTALQDALTATPQGAKLRIPFGAYVYSTGLTRVQPISIEGEGTQGATGAVLKYTGSGTALDLTTSQNGTRLSHFRIEGTSSATRGIAFRDCFNNIVLFQVMVEAFSGTGAVALYLSNCFDITIFGGSYRQSYIGVQGDFVATTVNAIRMYGTNLANCVHRCVDIKAGQNWIVNGCDMTDIGVSGICVDIAQNMGVSLNPVAKNIVISSNYMQSQVASSSIGVRVGAGATASTSAITNNIIENNFLDIVGADQVYVDVARDTKISGNMHGAVGGGAYRANITANAVRTYVDIRPRSNINDLGSNTFYFTNDIQSLVEVSGNYTSPQKSQFIARPNATISNVTGNGTVYTVIMDTEIEDAQSEYNTATGVFTAQKLGQYQFSCTLGLLNIASATLLQVRLVTSNRTYDLFTAIPAPVSGTFIGTWSTLAEMDASDTAYITVEVSGLGADTADISTASKFSGFLI